MGPPSLAKEPGKDLPNEKYSTTKSNIKNPPIAVKLGTGKPTLDGKSGVLPTDPSGITRPGDPVKPSKTFNESRSNALKALGPKGTGDIDTPTDDTRPKNWNSIKSHTYLMNDAVLNKDGKLQSLAVDKPGRRTVGLPKGESPRKEGRVGAAADDKVQRLGSAPDDKLHSLLQAEKRDDLSRQLKQLKESPDPQTHAGMKHLNLDTISGVHQERLAKLDNFEHWLQSNVGQKLGLQQQFALQHQGDLSRRMNLSQNLLQAGGWAQHRHHGVIAAGFKSSAFSVWYAGGGCYPAHSWCPAWSPWVDWCWWDTCPVFYDPRPHFCIPFVYDPCLPWVYYDYPVWNPLPVVSCGTWIDVSPVVVSAGQDVQLLAVRFVDNGHPEQNLGSRYRAWVRNNSPVQIVTPFSVLLLASNELTPTVELPQTGVVVPSMDIGETKVLDIRLPLAANRLGVTPEGYRVPFTYLHALVDSHQQIPETFEDNNGAVLLRTDILPVDPAAFSTDLTAAAPESLLTIAGEGFGPEPGQVIVSVYGQQVQAEIHGWYDLGIRFEVPNFELTQPVEVEVLVVRGDSAVSNPLTVRLAPKEMLAAAAVLPESPIPAPPQ